MMVADSVIVVLRLAEEYCARHPESDRGTPVHSAIHAIELMAQNPALATAAKAAVSWQGCWNQSKGSLILQSAADAVECLRLESSL